MQFTMGMKVGLPLITVMFTLGMIVYCLLKGRKTRLLYSYIFCQGMIFLWSFGRIFEILAANRQDRLMYVTIEYFAVCFIGASWLIFSLLYTEPKVLARNRTIMLLLIPPALFYILLLTNGYHHMFFAAFEYYYVTYGLFFWLHTAISYLYLLIGIAMLIRYSIRQFGTVRKQSVSLIVAVAVPFFFNILNVIDIIFKTGMFGSGIDLTPICFSVSLLFFAIAAFKYRFLNIVPIALRKIVDSMKEVIIVIDNYNKIIDYSRSFPNVFKDADQVGNSDNFASFVRFLESNVVEDEVSIRVLRAIQYGTIVPVNGELCINVSGRKYFSVYVQPIFSNENEILGRVASFNDISEYKNLVDQLNRKNVELMAANKQLKEYALAAENRGNHD